MKMTIDPATNELLDYYFPAEKEVNNASVEDTKKEKWQPKKWKLEYEEVVLMDLAGLKGYEIAEKVGLTPQHVYNILGTDEAIAIQRAMIGKVRQKSFDISEELGEIQELTVKRLKSCLKDEDTFKTSRLGFISKGIEVMKGLGEHLKHSPSVQVTNQFAIPPSVADRFLLGLEKADEARALRAGREVGVVESTD